MGKGKKKANNKKRGGKKTRHDKVDDGSPDECMGSLDDVEDDTYMELTPEHYARARLASVNRTEDPLKNWIRPTDEECPICILPLPFEPSEYKYCYTCGNTVCMGCMYSRGLAHTNDGVDAKLAVEKAFTCPFCRSDTSSYDDKYALEQDMKRTNAGNGEAMFRVGNYYFHGRKGLQQDKAEGLKWVQRAVEAGSGCAAFHIGECYFKGDGVDEDHDKALEYFQKAADLGFPPVFTSIGELLFKQGDIEEGVLNFRKAVMCGISIDSLFDLLRESFKEGYITKEEYAFTLRENQKANNEMKSEGREMFRNASR